MIEGFLVAINYFALLVVVPSFLLVWIYCGRTFALRAGLHNEPALHLCSSLGFIIFALLIVVFKVIFSSWTLCLVLAGTIQYLIGRQTKKLPFNTSPLSFITVHWLVWSIVNLLLAMSLFDQQNGISTYWINNYGDLTFHLGMIAHFTFNPNGLFEFHLASGAPLNYPIFLNLVTAAFWSIASTFISLKFIFITLWLWSSWVLWGVFRGSSWIWAVLFGGGSLYYIGNFTSEYIEYNGFWTVFLSSVWIPQRTSWTGIAVVGALWRLLYERIDTKTLTKKNAAIGGILFGVSTMVHFHSALVLGMLAGLLLLCVGKMSLREKFSHAGALGSGALLGAIFFIPWFGSKSSSLEWMNFWSTHKNSREPLQQLVLSLGSWGVQLWPLWCLLLITIFTVKKRRELARYLLVFFCVFLFGNTIKMAYWSWDQIKFFVPLYVALLLFISFNSKELFATLRMKVFAHVMLFLLCLPAIFEVYKFVGPDNYQIFSPDDVADAQAIREQLPLGAPIIADEKHNNAMVLSGHPLYVGYAGTLWSHGMQQLSESRTEQIKNLCDVTLPRFVYAKGGELYDRVISAGCFKSRRNGLWERE